MFLHHCIASQTRMREKWSLSRVSLISCSLTSLWCSEACSTSTLGAVLKWKGSHCPVKKKGDNGTPAQAAASLGVTLRFVISAVHMLVNNSYLNNNGFPVLHEPNNNWHKELGWHPILKNKHFDSFFPCYLQDLRSEHDTSTTFKTERSIRSNEAFLFNRATSDSSYWKWRVEL